MARKLDTAGKGGFPRRKKDNDFPEEGKSISKNRDGKKSVCRES
jgi:hypothetical protein